MALSNAERQRRFRQRRKEALRNNHGSLASLYADIAREYLDDLPDGPEAEVAALMEAVLFGRDSLLHGIDPDDMTDTERAFVTSLCGIEYLRDFLAWHEECSKVTLRNKRKHKNNHDALPTPPDLPVT